MMNSVIDTPIQNFVFLADQKLYSSSIIKLPSAFGHSAKAYQTHQIIEVQSIRDGIFPVRE